MNRQTLINQVKSEYARIADLEGRELHAAEHFGSFTPEGYYERLLGEVVSQIEAGVFDGFVNGREIVEAVAGNHGRWGISF